MHLNTPFRACFTMAIFAWPSCSGGSRPPPVSDLRMGPDYTWWVRNSLWDPRAAQPTIETRAGDFTITADRRGEVFMKGAGGAVRVASLSDGESFDGWYLRVTFADREGLYQDMVGYRIPMALGGQRGASIAATKGRVANAKTDSALPMTVDPTGGHIALQATSGTREPLAVQAFSGQLAIGMSETLVDWASGGGMILGYFRTAGIRTSIRGILRGAHKGTFLRLQNGLLVTIDPPAPTGR